MSSQTTGRSTTGLAGEVTFARSERRMFNPKRRIGCLSAVIVLTVALHDAGLTGRAPQGPGDPLPAAAPESAGFSPERLARLHARMQRFVDEGQHAGLATMKVFKGGTARAPVVVPARTPITIKHLLTHTSGFIYDFGTGPLDQIYKQVDVFEASSLDQFVSRAATLPLAHEPGSRFAYGISSDILGAVVEKVSGQKFQEFVEERICRPLRMRDTGFDVPAEKMTRLAIVYEHVKGGTSGTGSTSAGNGASGSQGRFLASKPIASAYAEKGRGFAAGGSGMFSTIGDYARFAQMLLNGGELDGVRILGRKTIELMTANHLNYLPRVTHAFSDSDGFGLGVAVRVDLARSNELGSVGQFGWSGAATTTVNIDPQERLVALVFAQHMPFNEHDLFWNFTTLTYQALVN